MVARDIAQSRYKNLFKIKTEEVEIEMGKFFFTIYKTIGKAQIYLSKAEHSSQLKRCVIESFMDNKLLGIPSRLTARSIEERGKTMRPEELEVQVKKEIDALSNAFDVETVRIIDGCYNTILRLINFIMFDYYSLLTQFDSNIPEHDFNYQPEYRRILGEKISDNLKDFMEVAYAVDMGLDWKYAIKIINVYKNLELISVDEWNKLLVKLQDVQSASIFLLIVRFVDKSPAWQVKPNIPKEHIIDTWLEEIRLEAYEALEKLLNTRRNAAVTAIATQIFGTMNISKLTNYTEEMTTGFFAKKLEGYTHTIEMRYLKAFMQLIFKNEIYPVCEIFLIKGQWVNHPLSQQMSEAAHSLMTISEKIDAFDKSLGTSNEYGDKIRLYVTKSDREKSYIKYSNNLFRNVNNNAQSIINSAGQSLIIIGKYIKAFLDDKQKKKHDFIINWKEITAAADVDISITLQNCYQKIYDIVRLFQIFSKPLDTAKKDKE
ncbi:MAG: DUF5312 family protein [Treponema sp.]|nr:DUF5312 family protein [Treponema sp.]